MCPPHRIPVLLFQRRNVHSSPLKFGCVLAHLRVASSSGRDLTNLVVDYLPEPVWEAKSLLIRQILVQADLSRVPVEGVRFFTDQKMVAGLLDDVKHMQKVARQVHFSFLFCVLSLSWSFFFNVFF